MGEKYTIMNCGQAKIIFSDESKLYFLVGDLRKRVNRSKMKLFMQTTSDAP
jgi:hypothetical protein